MAVRWTATAAVLVSGLAHLWLWGYDGFRLIAWIGPLFLANAFAAVVIGGLLVIWRSWVPPLLALGFGATTLGAFLVSATVGLLGLHEILLGPWQVVCAVAEVVAVVAGLALLGRERPLGRWARRPRGGLAPGQPDVE